MNVKSGRLRLFCKWRETICFGERTNYDNEWEREGVAIPGC